VCKIILKLDAEIRAKEIENHRENCEEGAGILGVNGGNFISAKGLTHQEMWDEFQKIKGFSPFWLFHSRLASVGSVCQDNVQPFGNSSIALCHNGTLSRKEMLYPLIMNGYQIKGFESDTKLLFEVLEKSKLDSAITLLEMLDQNFVFVSIERKRIYIIGDFKLHIEKGVLISARNEFYAPSCNLVVKFNGEIEDIWVEKKTKFYAQTHYIDDDPLYNYDYRAPNGLIVPTKEEKGGDNNENSDTKSEGKAPSGGRFTKSWR